jgi:cobalt-zinc-cadmium efflux system membrane fusion protein
MIRKLNIIPPPVLYMIIVALAFALVLSTGRLMAQDEHDHDHEQPAEAVHAESEDEHEGHGEEMESDSPADPHDQEDHTDELIVELTPAAAEMVGLKMSTVSHGRVGSLIELPGEVGFNEDQLAHISPRFAGIALEVKYRVGDYVEAGSAMAVVESNESMNPYTITAPMSGWVIDRHITPGEFVSQENSIYVIADLSTVWVNLAVYPKDCDCVLSGQVARIKSIGGTNSTEGTIDYITPIIDLRTRSATARITLPNPDNIWRPGTFVQATVATEGKEETLVVEKAAVQYLDDVKIVFVVDGPNKFRPVEVIAGESDDRYTQIVSGLDEGVEYVSQGAFELKARIVTSNLDAHAGHGH